MATAIQFLRSSTPRLRPQPSDLALGMPMVNLAPEEPGLYFRTTNDQLFKVGPTHIGPNEPNYNAPHYAGNTVGEMWYDTVSESLKIWNGSAWEEVKGGDGGPQVQSDWTEISTADPAFIKNKPTNLSDFTNDSSFITLDDVPQSNWTESNGISKAFIKNKPTNLSDFTNDLSLTDFGDGSSLTNISLTQLIDTTIPNSITTNDVLTWNGTAWVPAPAITAGPGAELQGELDVADAPAGGYTPEVGHIWIQVADPGPGPVTADGGWTGIGGESVEDGAYIIYGDNNGSPQWFVANNVTAQQANSLDEVLTVGNSSAQGIILLGLGLTANSAGSYFNGQGIEARNNVRTGRIAGQDFENNPINQGLIVDYVDYIRFAPVDPALYSSKSIQKVGSIEFIENANFGTQIRHLDLIEGRGKYGSKISGFDDIILNGADDSQLTGVANIYAHRQADNMISGFDQIIGTSATRSNISEFALVDVGAFFCREFDDASDGGLTNPTSNVMPFDIDLLPALP